MRSLVIAALSIASWSGAAAAQDADMASTGRSYVALGVLLGGEVEFCDEDDECGGGGIGGFARYGYRANRFLSVEGEAGIAPFEGNGFFHAAGLGVLNLPVGPVDLRVRGGGALFGADGGSRLGLAAGPGVGVRFGEGSAARFDILALIGDDDGELEGFDAGVLLTLGYERRF